MLLLAMMALYLRWKKKLYDTVWFLKSCILLSPIGFISIIAGWFTAEFGRQPWIVYHYLRRADAYSPVTVYQVAISLAAIILVYGIIFGYFYFRYAYSIIEKGPAETEIPKPTFSYMPPPGTNV